MLRRAEVIRQILDRTLLRMGLAERLKEVSAVEKFGEAVGPEIAKRAQALSIKDGRLHLKVESPAWRQELSYSKEEIMEKLNLLLGEDVVKDIYFSS